MWTDLDIIHIQHWFIACRGDLGSARKTARGLNLYSWRQNYEREAISAFWGNAAFMRECVPPGSPIAKALTIYLIITTDGEIKKALITPNNTVAQCIV